MGILTPFLLNAQINSSTVIATADSYKNLVWTSNSSNDWNNVNCGGKIVNTPDWVSVGGNTSMPYCWGGNSTISMFNSGLSLNKSAGDDITTPGYGAEPNCSVGVDCSGFLSRCFGLSFHYSTSNIDTNSLFGTYSNTNSIGEGDLFNKSGVHTRLVKSVNANGTFNIIESGTGTSNVGSNGLWKVFDWTYNSSELSTYTPKYYVNMVSSNTTVSNDQCNDALLLTSGTSCDYTTGTVDGAGSDNSWNDATCDNFSYPAAQDVFYKFIAVSTSHTVELVALGDLDAVLSVYEGANCNNLEEYDCNDQSGTGNSTLDLTGLTVNDTYWIRVYDYGSLQPSDGDFDICVTHTTSNGGGGAEDITVSNVSVTPTTVLAGDEVSVSADQNYSGDQLDSALPNFDLGYYLSDDCDLSSDDVLLGDDSSSIGSDDESDGESADLTIPLGTSAGTYYILFSSDDEDELTESDEDNNVECIEITITGSSGGGAEDITVSNVSVTPTTVLAGDEISVSADQNYSGDQLDSALPNFDLGYYLSDDCDLSSDDVLLGDDSSSIGSDDESDGESADLTIPLGTSAGTYYILFSSDDEDELTESDESNNVSCVEIIITTESTPCELEINAGSDLEITCEIVEVEIEAEYMTDVTYSWQPTNGLDNPSISNPIASPNETTVYTLTIEDDEGCESQDQITVYVNTEEPDADAGDDVTIENGTPELIGSNAESGYTYVWSPCSGLSDCFSSNPSVFVESTTVYTVTVLDVSNGCSSTDEVIVNGEGVGLDEFTYDIEVIYLEENKSLQIYSSTIHNTFEIYDLQGKLILSSDFNANNTIDVSSFSKGIYYLIIDKMFQHKVIIY